MLICKYCVATLGFSLADKERIFETEDELYDHIEDWHGTPVIRGGETREDAEARCRAKGIVPDRAKCQCRDCQMMRQASSKSYEEMFADIEEKTDERS